MQVDLCEFNSSSQVRSCFKKTKTTAKPSSSGHASSTASPDLPFRRFSEPFPVSENHIPAAPPPLPPATLHRSDAILPHAMTLFSQHLWNFGFSSLWNVPFLLLSLLRS